MIDELASYLDDMRIPYVRSGEHDLVVDYYNDPHPVAESMDGTFIVSGCTVEQVADAVSNAFRELCVTAKARYETAESVLERTRADNAKLRQQLADVTESMGRVEERCAKLRVLASELYQQVLQDDAAWHDVRAWEDGLPSDCLHPIRSYDDSLGKHAVAPKFEQRMRNLGVEL